MFYVTISVGQELHSLAGFSVSGSHNAAMKVLAGLGVSAEAQLGRIHF